MENNVWNQITAYFNNNPDTFLLAVKEHLQISAVALLLAVLIGIPAGCFCVKYKKVERQLVAFFQVLRIIPSLAVLLLLLPLLGTGARPAIVALVLLAVPPVLMNTVAGLEEVPAFMLESAYGIGMTEKQVWWKIKFPLALPLIFAGVKTALIEIISSATLASRIGAGGLGGIIFTGLGLNRADLLLVGGFSVALLTIFAGLLLDLAERSVSKYKYVK